MWANFEIHKQIAILKIKSDPIFMLGMFKNRCWFLIVGQRRCGDFVEKIHTFTSLFPQIINKMPTSQIIYKYPTQNLYNVHIWGKSLHLIHNQINIFSTLPKVINRLWGAVWYKCHDLGLHTESVGYYVGNLLGMSGNNMGNVWE